MRISHFFIDRPIFASVVSIVFVILGAVAFFRLPIAQYPEIAPPTINVTGQYPGASADVVASTVVAPIEEQINGVENMLYLSSNATADGRFTIGVTFDLGTNLDIAQVQVQNRLSIAQPRLPAEVLNKPDSYDPRSDSLVRVLASRLRLKLKEYYRDGGNQDPLLIDFPKGRYVPCFRRRDQLRTENENKVRARAAYSCGRFLAAKLTDEALGESIAHFNEAIAADSSWPLAYIGLANVYAFQALMGFRRPREVWPLARAAAQTALQIDEMSSKAHIVLALE